MACWLLEMVQREAQCLPPSERQIDSPSGTDKQVASCLVSPADCTLLPSERDSKLLSVSPVCSLILFQSRFYVHVLVAMFPPPFALCCSLCEAPSAVPSSPPVPSPFQKPFCVVSRGNINTFCANHFSSIRSVFVLTVLDILNGKVLSSIQSRCSSRLFVCRDCLM